MSTNATALVGLALNMLGVTDPGETPNTSEVTDATQLINNLIDSMNLERLNIPVITQDAVALTSGTGTYTTGSGGTFNTTRIIRITDAGILVANANASGKFRFPLKIVGQQEWAQRIEQAAGTVVALILYYDYDFPVGNLNLWPVPTFTSTAPELELYFWTGLAQFPDLVTNISFAPGYFRLLATLAAIEIASMFSKVPTETLMNSATEARAAFRALNAAQPGLPPPEGPLSAVPAPPPAQG
jgi:hypothetical protein